MALSIGIDLGTTNSVAAAATPRGVEFTLDARGQRVHPSVVAYPSDDGLLVGHEARDYRTVEPECTVYSAKRLIGQNMRSPLVQLALAGLPYQVTEGRNQQPIITVRKHRYTVPEIAAEILAYLRSATQRQFGQDVREAVITVPANFSDAQRQATKEAGRLAGLDVQRLINEPTAAALAHGYGHDMNGVIAVFDFGGGTFDISLLRIQGQIFEVAVTDGDMFLGGDDLDRALAEHLAADMHRTMGLDPRPYPDALTQLALAAEQIKCRLSEEEEVEGTIDHLPLGGWDNLVSVPFRVTRAQFDSLISGYVDQTIEVCRRAMVAGDFHYGEIMDVICVGGSTRIPLVGRRLAELFGREPSMDINPDEVVAMGAAIQAGSLSGKLTQGTGMATREVSASTPPRRAGKRAATGDPAGKRAATGDPAGKRAATADPVLTPGPRISTTPPVGTPIAAAIDDALPRPLLLDVTPAALRVATAGGFTDCILDRNAPIPIERTKRFTTAHNNQERVVIECCRGDSTRLDENELLGTLVLDELPRAPRGHIQIDVTFRVDADGILHVRARDVRTGKEQVASLQVLGAPVAGDANSPEQGES